MDELQARLTKCFVAVFPNLKQEEIRKSTPATIEGWDSVATVTLLTLIEEEFGINVTMEDLEHFTSFEEMHNYLQGRLQEQKTPSNAD